MKKSPAAIAVAAGILLSRIMGLVRERVFAHYLGNSDAAGAFRAALRIPNLLQNLFGEGVLSASFIPVYAKLLEEGKEDEARKAASVVLSLLVSITALLVIIGVTFSRPLIGILAPGFHGEVRELTIRMVAIMFPGTGLLVLSAWCLGVLNSHRNFFLSYVAPVLWNFAIIAVLVGVGGYYLTDGPAAQSRLVIWVAWSTVIGAALQWGVQFPRAIRLNGAFAFSLKTRTASVQKIITNFMPAVVTRGVVQLSAYIDQVLASYLGPASVAAMAYAQTIYTLPVSLFGMAISAAALTEMSRTTGSQGEIVQALETRLTAGIRRMAFLVVPSAVAFVVLGDVVTATLFQTGHFGGIGLSFRLVHPGGERGRARGQHPITSLRIGLLGARQHQDAAAHSMSSRGVDGPLRLPCGIPPSFRVCARCHILHCCPHCIGGNRGLDRVSAVQTRSRCKHRQVQPRR